ncbi:hypothetical protein B0H16DRAFT_1736716 [Mycena metata]|uniref:Uncharacterized protein n=1 Tax=Mycena metata TaxID=1033252 RepID=A0AAD7HNL5_9AGAR|nr:hypothetical protein B0H16DRAFT_1736716 [Mycena metata]
MAIIDSQKSRTICARDTNPPKSSKPHTKSGPKPKAGPRTTAHFDKDARREDLTFHNWGQVFDWMDDHGDEEPEEPEFKYSKKDAMAAVDLLQKIVQHHPDLDEVLPFGGLLHKFWASIIRETEEGKVQGEITSFFK